MLAVRRILTSQAKILHFNGRLKPSHSERRDLKQVEVPKKGMPEDLKVRKPVEVQIKNAEIAGKGPRDLGNIEIYYDLL